MYKCAGKRWQTSSRICIERQRIVVTECPDASGMNNGVIISFPFDRAPCPFTASKRRYIPKHSVKRASGNEQEAERLMKMRIEKTRELRKFVVHVALKCTNERKKKNRIVVAAQNLPTKIAASLYMDRIPEKTRKARAKSTTKNNTIAFCFRKPAAILRTKVEHDGDFWILLVAL